MANSLDFFNEIEDLANLGSNEALEMRMTLSEAYNNRGLTRYKQIRFDDAHDDYTTAITLNPDIYQAYYNRGTIRYRLGDFEKAKTDFELCLELNPHFEEARKALKATNES